MNKHYMILSFFLLTYEKILLSFVMSLKALPKNYNITLTHFGNFK